MLSKTKVAVFVAIVLSNACSASAATKHHRVTHVHPAIYNRCWWRLYGVWWACLQWGLHGTWPLCTTR